MPPRIHDIVADGATRHAARAAISVGDRAMRYDELSNAVDAWASALAALGVRAGDRVLIVAENDPEVFFLMFAASRLEAWAVPVHARLAADEIDAIARHADPRVALYAVAESGAAAAHASPGARSCEAWRSASFPATTSRS